LFTQLLTSKALLPSELSLAGPLSFSGSNCAGFELGFELQIQGQRRTAFTYFQRQIPPLSAIPMPGLLSSPLYTLPRNPVIG
jgi:hypothetical protein